MCLGVELMKIAIKYTLEISDEDLPKYKNLYEDSKANGESFRDFIINRFISDGEGCLDESVNNFNLWIGRHGEDQ
jgi:hypothetical protein